VPIALTFTSPYGSWVGLTHCRDRRDHLIELTAPAKGVALVAGRSTLLHEMVHQCLAERGEPTNHDSESWCREIMRLHQQITGERLWATPERVGKDANRRSVCYQCVCPHRRQID